MIIVATILMRTPSESVRVRLIPFWSYSRPWVYQQIIWNILIFAPVGFMAGHIWGWKSVLIGLGFSIAIEITQLISHRGLFEFDDMIHNTLGTAIGFLICYVIARLQRKAG